MINKVKIQDILNKEKLNSRDTIICPNILHVDAHAGIIAKGCSRTNKKAVVIVKVINHGVIWSRVCMQERDIFYLFVELKVAYWQAICFFFSLFFFLFCFYFFFFGGGGGSPNTEI